MSARKVGWLSLLAAMLLTLTTLGWSECSVASLNGTYGVLEQGTIFSQISGFPLLPPYPVVLAANALYDGAGNLSGTFKISISGLQLTGTFAGTYDLTSDCLYSEQFIPTPPGLVTLHDSGVVTGDGAFREIHYIYTDSDRVISGTAKKAPPGGCSLETLKGKYAVFGQGTIFAPGGPPLMADHVGPFTADGAGHFSGSDDANLGGTVVHRTFTGNAEVNSDCTVSLIITNSQGLVAGEWGTITGQGRSQEFNGIVTNPGWVFAENAKKQ